MKARDIQTGQVVYADNETRVITSIEHFEADDDDFLVVLRSGDDCLVLNADDECVTDEGFLSEGQRLLSGVAAAEAELTEWERVMAPFLPYLKQGLTVGECIERGLVENPDSGEVTA